MMGDSAPAGSSTSAAPRADSTKDAALPRLPTPDSFPFPYAQPYSIQLDLMRTVFAAIEDRKVAIVSFTSAIHN